MKKLSKIDESVWADIHRRSNGENVRKEDDISNVRHMKPIDLGDYTTVLWADEDLKVYDEYWFNYIDAEKYLKDTGWRLPTRKEAEELFYIFNGDSFKREDTKYIFTIDDSSLIFEAKGFKYSDTEKIIYEKHYNCWTSTVSSAKNETHYKLSLEPHYGTIARFHSTYPFHDLNRLCVRPVKDK